MNENILLLVDYDKICRLCLLATGAMSDLFERSSEKPLKDLVLRATGLSVEEHDGFPTKICHKCRYIVELNCELRDMVEKTNMLLVNASNHLETTEEESEKTTDKPITKPDNTVPKKVSSSGKPDLRLIMQDDGVMALVNADAVTTVDKNPDNIDGRSKGIEEHEEEIKIISRERKVLPKELTCQICLTEFNDAKHVNAHVGVHYFGSNLTPYTRLQRPYKCEACSKILNKPQLIHHHRTHLNINPFVCKQAGCKFVGKSQVHMTRAHRLSPAQCRTCRKRFRNAITLDTHVRHYHKPRRYKCEWAGCSKAYHTPALLAVHTRAHTGERLFRCHLCSAAAYTTQSQLNRHLRHHERPRLSKCDKCAATFDDYTAYYRHRISQHGRWMPYRCVGCHKRYHTESKLQTHLETCEQAIQTLDSNEKAEEERAEQLLDASIQEILHSKDKILQLEEFNDENTADLLDKFKGQSLLVQPGNISDLSKELELQDLPAGGLLYIEVDSEADDHDAWPQHLDAQN